MSREVTTVIISAIISGAVSYFMAERTARREFERDIQGIRTEFMAEKVARDLLNDSRWQKRNFAQIQRRLGGFEENELRKILVRAGAVRFYSKDGQQEFWGLRERNIPDLENDF